MTSWGGPVPCDAGSAPEVPRGPIVYRMTVLSETGDRRPVRRFWGTDLEGTLLIGETVNGRSRFKELVGAVRGARVGRGHGPGFTFYYWFRHADSSVENLRFEWIDLAPWLAAFGDRKKLAQAAELLLMEGYRGRHGDLPPCNAQSPKWWAVTEWMHAQWGIPKGGYVSGAPARLNVPLLDLPGIPAISIEQAKKVGSAD